MKMMTSILAMLAARAFANPGWKLDDQGKVETKDGNPIWLDANGKEAVMQGDTISRLNAEAAQHRKDKETAEAKLRTYEGLDPEAARKAVETVGKLDAKKLIDAGEVDRVKEEIGNQYKAQLTDVQNKLNDVQSRYDNERINNVFASSEFIRDRIAMPRDFFEAAFRQNFKIDEQGKVVAFDKSGNRVMSAKNVGEYADPQEAMEILVNNHPQKDTILRASDHSGSGNGGGGGNRGGGAVLRRSDWEKMPAQQQAAEMAKVQSGEKQFVD